MNKEANDDGAVRLHKRNLHNGLSSDDNVINAITDVRRL